jgi:hypothetical protein
LNPTTKSFKKEKSPYYTSDTPSNKPIPKSVTTTVSLKEVHYLGMKPEDEKGEVLNDQISQAMGKIYEKYPDSKLESLKNALDSGSMESLGWELPSMPYHITTTLMNGKSTVKNKKAIEQFKIDLEEKLEIKCIIIVEDLFIATPITPKLIECDSKIPYMALWVNSSKPKDCKVILEHLLYKVKESMKHGEEKLRSYYSIQNKATFKDDVVGEIKMVFDVYKDRKVSSKTIF